MLKLSISNIAWDHKHTLELLPFFRTHNLSGIEIAPSKIWGEWDNITIQKAKTLKNELKQEGFKIPAFQAILFGITEARLFDKPAEEKFYQHIIKVADIASAMACPVLVWGAPSSRKKGSLTTEQALESSIEILKKTGEACYERGVVLCVEANPPEYGCDFIKTTSEALELIKKVDSKGFGLHLDISGATMVGEKIGHLIRENKNTIMHFHASEPNLAPLVFPEEAFGEETLTPHYTAMINLNKVKYDKWVSLEMRQPSSLSEEESVMILKRSIQSFDQYYHGDFYDPTANRRHI